MAQDPNEFLFAPVPMEWIGPIKILGSACADNVSVPLATFERPLWPSTHRGARVCTKAGGIRVTILDDRMTRSILVEANSAEEAYLFWTAFSARREEVARVCEGTSRHLEFVDMHVRQVGSLAFIRLEMRTGDASGHNMVTKAADALLVWIAEQYPHIRYVSISGNYCCDKKVSCVNAILGRGKAVAADICIPEKLVKSYLKSTSQAITSIVVKKNLVGSIIAGSATSANAHIANILLAIFLATGQDAANIVEGSQSVTYAEVREGDLYFSVTLPNIIVGTVGAGKNLDCARHSLEKMGCLNKNPPGANARRLAAIVGATALCGELSLLAAQTNPGELVSTHVQLERGLPSVGVGS